MVKSTGIKLKVVESLQDDVYKGVARIDPQIMRSMGLMRGDIITIQGGRETQAIVDRAYPADVGESIIRIDGLIRKNARIGVGEHVIVKKATSRPATKVIIAPAQQGIMVQGDPEMLKQGLLGRPVAKGDIISLGGVHRRRDSIGDGFPDFFGDLHDLFGGHLAFPGFQHLRFIVVSTIPNQQCFINEDSEIVLNPKAVDISEDAMPGITYEEIGGLRDEIKKIREMVELPLKHPEIFERLGIDAPKGVLLHGPPGTGKTLLAKAVANESDANFILLNGPEVMSKFYGESEKKIRDIFEEAEKHAPSIIFFDEIDAIAPKREDVQGEVERRVVSQLLSMMDGLKSRGKVVVIGATNRVNSVDPALRRPGRFDREIEISVPGKEARLDILKIHTRNMPLTKNVNLDMLAGKTHGFVGADLSALTKEAAMNVLRKMLPELKMDSEEPIPKEVLEKAIVRVEDFEDALKVVRPSAMREVFVETPNVSWEDVGGLEKTKQELKEAVEWPITNPDGFKRLGIRAPRGILLYGPPGTGKTLLAKAVAKESEANFIHIKGPSLLSMWVGKSLPYEEEVIVMKNGLVDRKPIGRLVENKEKADVISFDKHKKVKFSPIKDFILHNSDGSLVEITTASGRKIRVTKDHSLFSLYGTEIIDLPTTHLKENESYIAIPRKLPLPEIEPEPINLLHVLEEEISVSFNSYIGEAVKVLGKERSAEVLEIPLKYMYDVLSKELAISAKGFLALMKEAGIAFDYKQTSIHVRNSTHSMQASLIITPELCELLGLWVAEGDYNKKSVRIHAMNKEIRMRVRELLDVCRLPFSTNKETFSINSLLFQRIMKEVFKLYDKAHNKRIPALVFTLPRRYIHSFLRGYYSGDGSIYSTNGRSSAIEAATKSEKLANDLLYLLLGLGIVGRVYEKSIDTERYYRVMFMGVDYLTVFSEIGFIDTKRNNRILLYIKSKKWKRSDNIPITGDLYTLLPKSRRSNESIEREELRKIGNQLNNENILKLVDADVYFDKVVEITNLDYSLPVYDLTINPTENFVAGFGGVFVHNSEEGVRKVFERARQVAPCVVFFDEIDALAGKRGLEVGTKVTERVLNQLLAEIDGLEDLKDVTIIGATNRPDMLDPAILRPGRFDRVILVDIPDETSRQRILEIHTKKTPLGDDVDIRELVKLTDGFVGADLEALVREAALNALRKDNSASMVMLDDFDEAFKRVKPSVSRDTAQRYKKIEEYYLKRAKAGLESSSPMYAG